MSDMAHPPRPYFFPYRPIDPDYNDGDSPPSAVPHKSSYDLNSKILLTAIISLSFVVAVVTVLHLYARFVLRRRARRRAVIRRLTLNAAGSAGEPPASGLDSTAIASLPIFAYKKPADGQDDAASTECAVCLNLLEEEEMVRVLPNCRHTFHAECIDRWLSSRSTCPICRTEAEPRIQPEPREGPAAATAAPLERVSVEGTSSSSLDGGGQSGAKVSGPSTPRLSSFRRMLGRERSSRRLQIEVQDGVEDLERQ